MNAILLVLRTGMPWNALNVTGIGSSSSAHRRFSEWRDAGVFEAFWREALPEYDRLKGIDGDWLSRDGAMTKAPLGGEKTGPQPDGSQQKRCQASLADQSEWRSVGHCDGWRQPERHEAGGLYPGQTDGQMALAH